MRNRQLEEANKKIEALKNAARGNGKESHEKRETQAYTARPKDSRCHRCGVFGHWEGDCNIPQSHWICYKCNMIHEKRGRCQNREQSGGKFNAKRGNNRGRIYKRGRGGPKRNDKLTQVALAAAQTALAEQ
ncbi:serine/arginine-rich splicing factor RS2Z32-like [Cephus cinctus]|uniref:Serine/arginine-rich splicing factor RS2Z32-like n=1 Tax=Cephus cinctus TaxID=211228 RepID=A0AAJ7W7U6_CEPCN|nr:serine/arginine-rich splicing factor RS2Z32-like [Cephus cinctus]